MFFCLFFCIGLCIRKSAQYLVTGRMYVNKLECCYSAFHACGSSSDEWIKVDSIILVQLEWLSSRERDAVILLPTNKLKSLIEALSKLALLGKKFKAW